MDRAETRRILETHGPEAIITTVGPYLTEARRRRIEAVLPGRMAGVRIAAEAPSDPHNAAAIVRTAEALGVLDVHVIAAEGDALHARGTTQGAFRWVQTHHHRTLQQFLERMRRSSVVLAGACVHEETVPLGQVPIEGPLCLLLGNEQRGLSQRAKAACDHLYSIPMFGMSESLNLSVSAAISLYDVLGRRRHALGSAGDLSSDALARLRAQYYLNSVDTRLVRGLLGSG